MAHSGEEIRANLTIFAAKWSVYDGGERSEAQTFLNELFDCYGTSRQEVARFEQRQGTSFVDLIWPRVCLIEMKAPSETTKLASHRKQALDYWLDAADPATNTPAPRWVVLCSFHEQLQHRSAADDDVLRDFLLQTVWCLFAEDLVQIPGHRFTTIVDDLIANPAKRSSSHDLFGLFEALNDPTVEPHGPYAGVPYANGKLFERPAKVHLHEDELRHLRDAAEFKWNEVQPSIFGSLLEGGLGHDRAWTLGAHYTHEADIQKVVQPTIVEPWRARIDELEKHADAVRAQNDLLNYVVLDPACGSGNFLYVAYRELRRLEHRLGEREAELRAAEGKPPQGTMSAFFPLTNIRGIEIDGFAVALARVTLWMGHTLSVRELELDERTLPLADLSGIQIGDALKLEWPRADAIIGNPPFHGSQHLRSVLGDTYVDWLKNQFQIGVKDYCVYWFRRAHEVLPDGARAGLVGTNSVSQNKGRSESLDYIVENNGVITNAVSTQRWPGEAKVHVSIVNWVKAPDEVREFVLDGHQVEGISSALREGTERPRPRRLAANGNRAYQGPIPAGAGFIISATEAESLLEDTSVPYADVVKRYLMGDDVANDPRQEPTRWIIDFGILPLEIAEQWPKAMQIVRERVRPMRVANRDRGFREKWWQFGRPRPEMRAALREFDSVIVANRVGKRLFFTWAKTSWCFGDKIVAFKLADSADWGVLSSRIHTAWGWMLSSTLKADLNYTPTTAIETFPWPQTKRAQIAAAAEAAYTERSRICLDQNIGLTKLYNQMDDGAWQDLRDLHRELDEAVAVAYGWPKSVAHDADESNRRLLELNRAIAAGEVEYDPFPER